VGWMVNSTIHLRGILLEENQVYSVRQGQISRFVF
jgi:hypothetical protein